MKRIFTPIDETETTLCSNRCKVINDDCKATLVLTDKRLYIEYDDSYRRSMILPTIDHINIDKKGHLKIRSFQDSITYTFEIVNSDEWKDKIHEAVIQKINSNIQEIIDKNPIIKSDIIHVVKGNKEEKGKLLIVKNHHMYIKYDNPDKRTEVILYNYNITKKDEKTILIDINGKILEVAIKKPDDWLAFRKDSEKKWQNDISGGDLFDSISLFFQKLGIFGTFFLLIIIMFMLTCVAIFLDTLGLIAIIAGSLFGIIILIQLNNSQPVEEWETKKKKMKHKKRH